MKSSRILYPLIVFAIAALVLLACSGKKHEEDHAHHHGAGAADEGDWKEMDSFHMIMAETFHPYKDSANLDPAKTHAEHLAMEAEKWAAATLPEKVANDTVRAELEKLKTDTRTLADQVKNGSTDESIGAQLTAVHDRFHAIQEMWYGK